MKIKIGDRVIDPNDQPVMVILTPKDKENIANMEPSATKYCAFPAGIDPEVIKAWMEEGD